MNDNEISQIYILNVQQQIQQKIQLNINDKINSIFMYYHYFYLNKLSERGILIKFKKLKKYIKILLLPIQTQYVIDYSKFQFNLHISQYSQYKLFDLGKYHNISTKFLRINNLPLESQNFSLIIQNIVFPKQMNDKRFDIKQTVNRNMQRYQYPSFNNHKSLIGWCSINYPKTLINPIHNQKPQIKSRQYDLDHLFQNRPLRERQEQIFYKPFTNSQTNRIEGFKSSNYTLATTKHSVKAQIFEKQNKKAQQYSSIKPLSCIIGLDQDKQLNLRLRQLNQLNYLPGAKNQQVRHLKKLPNSIITEQNLFQILGEKIEFVDLQNKTELSTQLLNRIGYFAPNIKQIVLSSTLLNDDILIRLTKSCKCLIAIDISKCYQLSEFGIKYLLQNNKKLIKFHANHNTNSINDQTISHFKQNHQLTNLSLNFCNNLTSSGIQNILHCYFQQLYLASNPLIKSQTFCKLIQNSSSKLMKVDFSYNTQEITNQISLKLSNCQKLQYLALNDCQNLNDQFINNMVNNEKVKGVQSYDNLKVIKLNNIINFTDSLGYLIKKCPSLEILELNNLEKLTDLFLDQFKTNLTIKKILINLTPNISESKIQQVRQINKNLIIHRNIMKITDWNDNGLRMPVPNKLKNKKSKNEN